MNAMKEGSYILENSVAIEEISWFANFLNHSVLFAIYSLFIFFSILAANLRINSDIAHRLSAFVRPPKRVSERAVIAIDSLCAQLFGCAKCSSIFIHYLKKNCFACYSMFIIVILLLFFGKREAELMCALSSGKNAILHLKSIWREIISDELMTGEFVYRLEKLIFRLDAIADKIFIKTAKAYNILLECVQLTEQFHSNMNKHKETAFLLLTRLEGCVDDLVQKTHEFRIKAG